MVKLFVSSEASNGIFYVGIDYDELFGSYTATPTSTVSICNSYYWFFYHPKDTIVSSKWKIFFFAWKSYLKHRHLSLFCYFCSNLRNIKENLIFQATDGLWKLCYYLVTKQKAFLAMFSKSGCCLTSLTIFGVYL